MTLVGLVTIGASTYLIIYGYGRFGREIAHGLAAEGQEVLVVEWDPYARPEPDTADRVRIVYGDADDHEFPGSLPLDSARWVVSTIPHLDTSRTLARSLERWGYQGKVAVTAHSSSARKQLLVTWRRGGSTAFSTPSRTPARRRFGACYRQHEVEPVVEVAGDVGSGCAGSRGKSHNPFGGTHEPSGMRKCLVSLSSVRRGDGTQISCWTPTGPCFPG